MCECRKNLEQKLLERFKEQKHEATEHSVRLTGYALIFGDSVTEKGCMGMELKASYPLKNGSRKEKVVKQSMIFTFCPFCGEKYA